VTLGVVKIQMIATCARSQRERHSHTPQRKRPVTIIPSS
jgi:hypothetical protein